MFCTCFSLETSRNWTVVYNGSGTEWIVSDDELKYHEAYVFRVAARNLFGWGPFSNDSLPFIYTPSEYWILSTAIFSYVQFVIKRKFSLMVTKTPIHVHYMAPHMIAAIYLLIFCRFTCINQFFQRSVIVGAEPAAVWKHWSHKQCYLAYKVNKHLSLTCGCVWLQEVYRPLIIRLWLLPQHSVSSSYSLQSSSAYSCFVS